LASHPSRPAIFACGLHSGKIVVLDRSRGNGQQLIIVSSSPKDVGLPYAVNLEHLEPLSSIAWLLSPAQKTNFFGHENWSITTSAGDGRILVWDVSLDSSRPEILLSHGILLPIHNLPIAMRPAGFEPQTGIGCALPACFFLLQLRIFSSLLF
jgi:hypothetical protein